MNERAITHTRNGRKRASYDSGKNSSNNRMVYKEPKNKSRSHKQGKFELTLKADLHKQTLSKKNNNISLNHTNRINSHRINAPNSNHVHGQTVLHQLKQSQNLSDLRLEVQELRMENQGLREELNLYKKSEKQIQYRMMKMEEDRESDKRQYSLLMNSQQQKIEQYGLKIKQLYEELIKEKKKNIVGDENQDIMDKNRLIISPTLSSITNMNYFHRFQEQGRKQFYANKVQNNIGNYQTEYWNIDHSYTNSSDYHNKLEKLSR